MSFSDDFEIMFKTVTGLWFEISLLSPSLYIGPTIPVFHADGNLRNRLILLNKFRGDVAIDPPHFFNNMGGIES